jgi:catechol 2,3-dioxygenase-like lactoylglutathione lyase family enzyme
MKIDLTSVLVDDQEKALRFYTEVLGFVAKTDIPLGDARWLTVVSPEGADGVELVLEPNAHPASQAYQKALYEDGIPLTSFGSRDVEAEYERLREKGVVFPVKPTEVGEHFIAVFEDGCGNLIQIHQV